MPARTPAPAPDLKLRVKRSTTGLGLFAGQDISKGTCIIEYVGDVLTPAQAAKRWSRYLFQINRRRVIDGSPRWNKARYINHHCRPNAEAEIVGGRVFISAVKPIKAGDEITYDYGKEYFDMFITAERCGCSTHQRKRAVQAEASRQA